MDSLIELFGAGLKLVGWLLGGFIIFCVVGAAVWIVLWGLLFRLMGG